MKDLNHMLTVAAKNGNYDEVRHLLKLGADPDTNNQAAMYQAAENNHGRVTKLIAKNCKDPEKALGAALCRAIVQKTKETALYLLNANPNIHIMEDYPIRKACSVGLIEITKMLIEKGADIYIHHHRPLKNALDSKHEKIVELLIKSYSTPQLKNLREFQSIPQDAVTKELEKRNLDKIKPLKKSEPELHI